MRFPLGIGTIILAVAPAYSQQPALSPATSAPASAVCSIEGAVANAQTGEPIRKAQVVAFCETCTNTNNHGPPSAVSDASGHFSLTGLEPGRYRVEANADRFTTQAYGARRPGAPGKPMDLAQGQTLRDLSIRLQPAGVITGTVRDEDGDPVVGVFVRATPGGRRRGSQSTGQAQTNDLGSYRIYGLAAGDYLIQVDPQPQRPNRAGAFDQTYLPTFSPGVTSAAAATRISVQPGAEVQEVDVDLRPVHAVTVRGRVLNRSTGASPQGGWVGLMQREPDPDSSSTLARFLPGVRYGTGVDAQGDFEIRGVPAGSYWLEANMPGPARQYQGRIEVEVSDTDIQGLTVPVGAEANLTGHIRVEPAKPFNYASLSINLVSEDGMGGGGAQGKADGSFMLQDVGPGNYRVNVAGFGEEYYVKSARLGGADVLETGLTIDSASPGSLEIVLSSQGGSISGTVFSDHQPTAATVVLVPNPPRRGRQDLYSMKPTKPDGTFNLIGLPPGDFKLFAFEDPDHELSSEPSVLQPYEAKGQSVQIEDGRSQSVQLQLIPAEAEQ